MHPSWEWSFFSACSIILTATIYRVRVVGIEESLEGSTPRAGGRVGGRAGGRTETVNLCIWVD